MQGRCSGCYEHFKALHPKPSADLILKYTCVSPRLSQLLAAVLHCICLSEKWPQAPVTPCEGAQAGLLPMSNCPIHPTFLSPVVRMEKITRYWRQRAATCLTHALTHTPFSFAGRWLSLQGTPQCWKHGGGPSGAAGVGAATHHRCGCCCLKPHQSCCC